MHCSWGATPLLVFLAPSSFPAWDLPQFNPTLSPRSYSHQFQHQATILPQFKNGWKILTCANGETVSDLTWARAFLRSGGLQVQRPRAFVKRGEDSSEAVLLS